MDKIKFLRQKIRFILSEYFMSDYNRNSIEAPSIVDDRDEEYNDDMGSKESDYQKYKDKKEFSWKKKGTNRRTDIIDTIRNKLAENNILSIVKNLDIQKKPRYIFIPFNDGGYIKIFFKIINGVDEMTVIDNKDSIEGKTFKQPKNVISYILEKYNKDNFKKIKE